MGDEQAWRDGLKVGDEVYLHYGFGGFFARVTSVTRTTFDVEGWGRFRKKDGRPYGPGRASILMPNDELRAEVEQRALRRMVSAETGRSLSLDQLRRIAAILNEPLTPSTGEVTDG